MSLKGYQQFPQRKFGGANLLSDPPLVSPPSGLLAQNVSFTRGQWASREGWQTVYTPPGGTTIQSSLKEWLSELGNYALYVSLVGATPTLNIFDVTGNPITPQAITPFVNPLNGLLVSYCQFGTRMGYTVWGTGNGLVLNGNPPEVISLISATFVSDLIAPGPLAYVPAAPTEPGAGVITAGLHNIGYRILTRSGWNGRLSPDNSSGVTPTPTSFTPVVFTAAGSKNLSVTLNPPSWPADGYQVQIVMSPVSNPQRYFQVPGATALLPAGGGAASKTIVFSIADEDMISRATECTDALNLFSNPVSGVVANTASLRCFYIGMMGNRAAYFVTVPDGQGGYFDKIIFSQPGDYQSFFLDISYKTLPGQYPCRGGFALLGNNYLFGPHKTFVTNDTNDTPNTWPGPTLVDGEKGTFVPRGAIVSPSGRYGWVADMSGLYYFDGAYARLPISYNQTPDWKKILWTNGVNNTQAFGLVDDPVAHKVYVTAFTTEGSVLMTWDYTNGFGPDQVMYSREYLGAGASTTALTSLELVENDLFGAAQKGGIEVWAIGGSTAGGASAHIQILRRTGALGTASTKDTYDGSDHAIHLVYEPFMHPANPGGGGGSNEAILQFVAAAMRVKGAGSLAVTLYSYDRAKSAALPAITLATAPDTPVLRQFRMTSPGLIYHFEINAVDSYVIGSSLTTYYKRWASKAGLGG